MWWHRRAHRLHPVRYDLFTAFTENVTVLYDGDPAGIKASIRGIDLLLEEGSTSAFLLPDGDDPDLFHANTMHPILSNS